MLNLVDQTTRRLTTQHAVYPMGVESSEETATGQAPVSYTRRYVCRKNGDATSCFSIGLCDRPDGRGGPGFNKKTPRFREISGRLENSPLAQTLIRRDGHLWMPLEVPLRAAGEQMVHALIMQTEAIVRVAFLQSSP